MPVSRTAKRQDARRRARRGRAAGCVSVTPPCAGELERVREQVLEDLLQPIDVGEDRLRQLRAHAGSRRRGPSGRPRAGTSARGTRGPAASENVVRIDRHLAGFDLREVEDLVDELQEIVARRVDRLRELHLLGGEVPVAVLRQHLREDEQAVERRPQLVRHVREELGLVLGDELQLLGLLLEARGSRARPRWFLTSSSFALSLSSPACASSSAFDVLSCCRSSSVRMLEEIMLRMTPTLVHQLIEERQVVRAELLERRELDDRLGLALEEDRQDDDAARRRLAHAGGDVDEVRRGRRRAGCASSRTRTGR